MRIHNSLSAVLCSVLAATLCTQATAAPNMGELEKQVAAAEAKQKAAEKKLADMRAEFKAKWDAFLKLKASVRTAERTVKSGPANLKKQQAALKTAEAARKKADAALAAAKKSKKNVAGATRVAAEAGKKLAAAQAAVKKTEAEIAKAKAEVAKADKSVKAAEAEVMGLQPKVVAQQQEVAKLAAETLQKKKAIEAVLIKAGKLVSFSDEIAPIFAKRCLACHNARTAKGRFNMETFAAMMKGGESGPVIDVKSPDFSTLVTMVEDGSMPKDADPLTKQQIALIKNWVKTGAKLNAGVSSNANIATIIPNVPQPNPPKSYRVPIPVTALAFSPDGKLLASSGYHEVILWNPVDGKIVRRITNVAERVYDLQFSSDAKTLAVAAGTPGQWGEAKLFNVTDGKLIADFVRSDDSVFAVAFSPDGKQLAAAGADRAIRVYDLATGKRLVQIEDHADWVMGIAWSPDGKKLASASRDKTSKVFDMSPKKLDPAAIALGTTSSNVLSGESLATFNSHGQPVYDVAFSSDGKSVITCGEDKQVRVWNPADGKQVRAIGGFGGAVFDLQVTKDGRVFSCSADKTARVHTFANAKAIRSFSGNSDWVYSVAYDPATKKVAAGSFDGTLRLFNETDGKLIREFTAAPGFKPPTKTAKK